MPLFICSRVERLQWSVFIKRQIYMTHQILHGFHTNILGCFEWLPMYCYPVAKVFLVSWHVAKARSEWLLIFKSKWYYYSGLRSSFNISLWDFFTCFIIIHALFFIILAQMWYVYYLLHYCYWPSHCLTLRLCLGNWLYSPMV